MNALCAEPRVPLLEGRGPLPDRKTTAFQVHRRLAGYIASRTTPQWVDLPPWRHPKLTGVLAVLAVGCAWGAIIGFALGGTVGVAFFLIGALYGAPIGAAVGLVVAVPASIVLAALLAIFDRPATDTHRLAHHVATSLAVLIELLATTALASVAALAATEGRWTLLLFAGPVLLLAVEATWMLRRAARDLVRTWARAWGWKVVR
jgi:hypothetical protein